ncbi:hypothetical protein ABR738_21570 [Streptomyces sp. Edi4]
MTFPVEGCTHRLARPKRHNELTVIGCPALEKLGSDGASGIGRTDRAS